MLLIIIGFLVIRVAVRGFYSLGFIGDTVLSVAQNYNTTMPRLLIGAIVGREKVFDSWRRYIDKRSLPISILFLVLLTIGKVVLIFGFGIESQIDFLWILFEMYALIIITDKISHVRWISKALKILGEYSLYIWLIHAIWISDLLKPVTYSFRIPLLIVTFAVVVSLFIGFPMRLLDRRVKHRITGHDR